MNTPRGIAAAVVVLAGVLAAGPGFAEAPSARVKLDAGGGLYVPFGDDTRREFGGAAAFHAGVALNPGWKSTWVMFDAAYIRSSGRDVRYDATFRTDESHVTVIPVCIGLRTMAGTIPEDAPVRLYLGFGLLTVFTSYSVPFTETSRTPTIGGMIELRPEFRLGPDLSLYARQRILAMLDTGYDNAQFANFQELNHTGTTIEAGLSWAVR